MSGILLGLLVEVLTEEGVESAVVFAGRDEEALVPFGCVHATATEDLAPLPPLTTSLRHLLFHGFRPPLHPILHHVWRVLLLFIDKSVVLIGLRLQRLLFLLLSSHFVRALAVDW